MPLGGLFDHLEHLIADGLHKLAGIELADAADHAEARYFSIPSASVGAEERRKEALNCWPCLRLFTQLPLSVTYLQALSSAAWPTTATRPR